VARRTGRPMTTVASIKLSFCARVDEVQSLGSNTFGLIRSVKGGGAPTPLGSRSKAVDASLILGEDATLRLE
jgi:hypothetical protein